MKNKNQQPGGTRPGADPEGNNIEYGSTKRAVEKKTRLSLSTYSPDLRQKRVQQRIIDALEYFMPYYQSGRELQLSTKVLEEHFGSHAKPMFNWLRRRLLREVRSYNTFQARAITYTVHQDGFNKLWFLIHGRTFDFPTERARQVEPTFRPYIDGEPLPLHNTIEGGRVYGPHQTLEKNVRAVLLKGRYDYDIQAAMPTLVLQSVSKDWRSDFPLWAKYLGSRKAFRAKVAKDYDLRHEQAKELFQALFDLRTFNGSRSGIGMILGVDKTKRAMTDPFLAGLRDEAVRAWTKVNAAKRNEGGKRFAYYEQLEQRVMNAVYDIAAESGVRYWPFHDGFTLLVAGQRITDLNKLARLIEERTGFSILLDEKVL